MYINTQGLLVCEGYDMSNMSDLSCDREALCSNLKYYAIYQEIPNIGNIGNFVV